MLIDFWTYSCINCIRTIPEVEKLYQHFKNKDFIVIGVHSPEFPFEENTDNVANAIRQFHITYPVVQDNQFETWKHFDNQYWPAQYLINKDGKIVYEHFGEGGSQIIKNKINELLNIKNKHTITKMDSINLSLGQTPETYLGLNRATRFSNNKYGLKGGKNNFNFYSNPPINHWSLEGMWDIKGNKIVALKKGASIKFNFNAKDVYLDAGSRNNKPIHYQVFLNNKLIKNSNKQVEKDSNTISNHMLYQLTKQKHRKNGIIRIVFDRPSVELYTFTFG